MTDGRHNVVEQLTILVDYFNIEPIERKRGLQEVAPQIIRTAFDAGNITAKRVNIRLYGGWYENQELSKGAQSLLTEIEDLSGVIHIPSDHTEQPVFFSIELAQSLLCSPGLHLFRTLRQRLAPKGIRPTDQLKGCPEAEHCHLKGLPKLLKKRKCPSHSCGRSIRELIVKTEQKMVDSMMCADASHLVQSGEENIVIVSSDEDLTPIILLGINYGINLIHIESASNISRDKQTIEHSKYSQGHL